MKNVLVSMFVVLATGTSQAAQYDCKLTENGDPNDPKAISYSIDTAIQDSKFVDMGQETSVGCVVFRSAPQLLSCGIGDGANFSITAVTEDGSAVLSLQTTSGKSRLELICVKHK